MEESFEPRVYDSNQMGYGAHAPPACLPPKKRAEFNPEVQISFEKSLSTEKKFYG